MNIIINEEEIKKVKVTFHKPLANPKEDNWRLEQNLH